MRKWLTLLLRGIAICIILAQALPAPAQQATDFIVQNAPIAPITLVSRRISHFFRQTLREASPYSGIMALVDSKGENPWYEVVLRETASRKQVYYCNSQSTVTALVADGEEAYFTPIEFSISTGANPVSRLQFNDSSKRAISWTFAVSSEESSLASTNGFIARPDDFGLVLLHSDRARKAAPSSTIYVGNNENVAINEGFYASDTLLVKIQPVTKQWNVSSVPVQLREGNKWTLRSLDNREGVITIGRIDGNEMVLNLQNSLGPNYPPMQMNVVRNGDEFALRSLAIASDPRAFRIAFQPPLPLPAARANDKTVVSFTIDADGHSNVASGSISAIRAFLNEHLIWNFNSPDWATAMQFDTGVITLFGTVQPQRPPITGLNPPTKKPGTF
jgi:hypothetical protein